MIQALLKIKVVADNRKKAVEIITFLLERIRAESGCLSCNIYQDMSNENTLLLLEEWESRADLERHICSEEYRHILTLIELSRETPEIRFNTISIEEGMEAIESTRS
jgi:quinol monooxygenase YgiN